MRIPKERSDWPIPHTGCVEASILCSDWCGSELRLRGEPKSAELCRRDEEGEWQDPKQLLYELEKERNERDIYR